MYADSVLPLNMSYKYDILISIINSCVFYLQGILKLDPELEIAKRFGPKPLPLDEIEVNIYFVLLPPFLFAISFFHSF